MFSAVPSKLKVDKVDEQYTVGSWVSWVKLSEKLSQTHLSDIEHRFPLTKRVRISEHFQKYSSC